MEVPSIGELNEISAYENEHVPPTVMASKKKAAELADKATIDPTMERQRDASDTCSQEPTDDNAMCPLDMSDIIMYDPEVETENPHGCDTDSTAQTIGAPIAPAVEQFPANDLWLDELIEAANGMVAECPLDISDTIMYDPEVETENPHGCDTDSAAQRIGAPIAPAVEQFPANDLWLDELIEAANGMVAECDPLFIPFDYAIFEKDSWVPKKAN